MKLFAGGPERVPPSLPYDESHLGGPKAAEYDRAFAAPRGAKALGWRLEQRLLDQVLAHELPGPPRGAVDLACGTGRVLAYLEQRVECCTGIDVSPDMLAIARERCRRARLIEADLGDADPGRVGHVVDLVTVFRFLLNAEPPLRMTALSWARAVLSKDGRLVANFHLNPHSVRGGYLRLRGLRRFQPMTSPAEARTMFAACGFVVDRCYGYQFLPFRRDGAALAFPRVRDAAETALLGRRWITSVAGAFLVVARPSS